MWDISGKLNSYPYAVNYTCSGIIDLETHELILKRFKELANKPQQDFISDEFLLRGHIASSCCGTPMTASMAQGRSKKYPYYRCRNNDCKMRTISIKRDEVESAFRELLETLRPPKDIFHLAYKTFEMLWQKRSSAYKDNAKAIKDELAQIDFNIEKLLERIVETDSKTIIKTYERSIQELKKRSILTRKKSNMAAGRCQLLKPPLKRRFNSWKTRSFSGIQAI
ncbi:zinc ribbon domain-containing protein [Pseudoalteromonas piscicida]|uniref:zinc ribbon domain-containing protein n=1 Tax=Pseudoalteromonas piscicida TaxID=43662 RepID=UPI0030C94043